MPKLHVCCYDRSYLLSCLWESESLLFKVDVTLFAVAGSFVLFALAQNDFRCSLV